MSSHSHTLTRPQSHKLFLSMLDAEDARAALGMRSHNIESVRRRDTHAPMQATHSADQTKVPLPSLAHDSAVPPHLCEEKLLRMLQEVRMALRHDPSHTGDDDPQSAGVVMVRARTFLRAPQREPTITPAEDHVPNPWKEFSAERFCDTFIKLLLAKGYMLSYFPSEHMQVFSQISNFETLAHTIAEGIHNIWVHRKVGAT